MQELEDNIGDAVLDHHLARRLLTAVNTVQLILGDGLIREFVTRQFIAPVAEGAFRELHDIAFMHQGHAVAVMVNGVLDSLAHQSLGGKRGNWLDAETGLVEEFRTHLIAQEFSQFGVFGRTRLVFNARVDVLGVLTEDDDIDLFRVAHR